MERQAGLGRSLEDVLDSMTPVVAEPTSTGRALFEPEDLEQQLDQLMGDIRDLRERVQHLVGMVSDDAMIDTKTTKKTNKSKKTKKAKKAKKTKNEEHAASRRGSASRKSK
jgi:TolA-binding protein